MSGPSHTVEGAARRTVATTARERSSTLDVLRGIAVFGILVANIEAFADPGYADRPPGTHGLDAAAHHLVAFAFEAKFYVLFSFLFGYGMAMQLDRTAGQGVSPVPRLLRRLLLLLALGAAHGVLLFSGDILMIYAIAGLPLLFLRALSARRAVHLALGILGCYAALVGVAVLTAARSGSPVGAPVIPDDRARQVVDNYLADPATIVQQRIADLGSSVAEWWVLVPIVLGYFLLGLAAGKIGLLHRRTLPPRRLVRAALLGLALGVPTALAFTLVAASPAPVARAAAGFGYFAAPALTVAYAALLLLAGRTRTGARTHATLAPVGRLALTNYLSQSLVCALLFTGYGFGLAEHVGQAGAIVIAVAIYAVQVVASGWWIRRYAFGPVEWALRTFTYLRWQPWHRPAGG